MFKFKKTLIYSFIALALVALPAVVLAGTNIANDSVYVSENEIIEGNLVRAGDIIEINGAVNGDVIVAGNSIKISGPVAGDVIVAGNSIKISGPVAGSIRAVGGVIEINNKIERNIWALGRTVMISEESVVGWDVFSAGETIEVRGKVSGNLWLTGTTVLVNNEVGKDATISVDKSGHIVLASSAKINGNLNYQSGVDSQLELQDGSMVVGETVKKDFVSPSDVDWQQIFRPISILFKIIIFFSLLVLGIVIVSLVPKLSLEVYDQMIGKVWPSIGWGLVYSFAIPVVAVLLFVTIIGIPLALMVLPIYFILIFVAKVLAGFAIGLYVLNNINKKKKYKGSLIFPLVLGLVIYMVVGGLPLIGWVLRTLAIWWALGSLMAVKKNYWRELR